MPSFCGWNGANHRLFKITLSLGIGMLVLLLFYLFIFNMGGT